LRAVRWLRWLRRGRETAARVPGPHPMSFARSRKRPAAPPPGSPSPDTARTLSASGPQCDDHTILFAGIAI